MSENDVLYQVNLKFESKVLGGGSMILRLAVDPMHRTLNGLGYISMKKADRVNFK